MEITKTQRQQFVDRTLAEGMKAFYDAAWGGQIDEAVVKLGELSELCQKNDIAVNEMIIYPFMNDQPGIRAFSIPSWVCWTGFSKDRDALALLRKCVEVGLDLNKEVIYAEEKTQSPDLRLLGSYPALMTACREVPALKAKRFKFLVEHGARLNVTGIGGNTPLHYLAESKDLDLIAFAIEKGGLDLLSIKNGRGNTPGDTAREVKNQAFLDFEQAIMTKFEQIALKESKNNVSSILDAIKEMNERFTDEPNPAGSPGKAQKM